MKIFVYGTLKRGYRNHLLLQKSNFLGEIKTKPRYTMISFESFPAVLDNGNTSISGEVYEIDNETLEKIDYLEGFPFFYKREKIETKYGDAWMYYFPLSDPGNRIIIKDGVW